MKQNDTTQRAALASSREKILSAMSGGVRRFGKRAEVISGRWSSKILGRLAAGQETTAGENVERPESILFVRPNFRMGNLLLVTPAIHAARTALPEATVGLLTTSSYVRLVDNHPDLDRLHCIDRKMLYRPDRIWRMLRELRSVRYDVAVDCSSGSSLLGVVLAIVSGAKYRLGSAQSKHANLFSVRSKMPSGEMHVIEEALFLLDSIGVGTGSANRSMTIRVSDEDQQWANARLSKSAARRVGVNIGARNDKRWPLEHFITVISELDRLGLVVTVFAGPQELDRLAAMENALPKSVLVDTTSDPCRFSALLAGQQLFITGDTGPMHLSIAVGTPTLAIFTRANAGRYGPIGLPHRSLYRDGGISATEVLETVQDMLQLED